jgi:transposase
MIRAMATTAGSLVSEQLWRTVQPLLPALPSLLWRSPSDRDALAGIVYQLPTGVPWRRLLPTRQLGGGSPVTCWRRLRDWPPRASTTSARRPSMASSGSEAPRT